MAWDLEEHHMNTSFTLALTISIVNILSRRYLLWGPIISNAASQRAAYPCRAHENKEENKRKPSNTEGVPGRDEPDKNAQSDSVPT